MWYPLYRDKKDYERGKGGTIVAASAEVRRVGGGGWGAGPKQDDSKKELVSFDATHSLYR